jgi:hypothetical protein
MIEVPTRLASSAWLIFRRARKATILVPQFWFAILRTEGLRTSDVIKLSQRQTRAYTREVRDTKCDKPQIGVVTKRRFAVMIEAEDGMERV